MPMHRNLDRRFRLIYQTCIPSTEFLSTNEQYIPIGFKMRQWQVNKNLRNFFVNFNKTINIKLNVRPEKIPISNLSKTEILKQCAKIEQGKKFVKIHDNKVTTA